MTAVVLAALLGGVSHALLITNVTNGGILFYNDGFEQDTVGSKPTYADPGTLTMSTARELVYGPESGGPGAYSGDQYLYTFRDATAAGNARFYFSNITDNGITVRYEWAWYMPTGADASVRLQGVSAADKAVWRFYNGNVTALVGTYQARGTYTRDEWLACSIEYTTGAEFATLTLNDVDIQMEVNDTVTGLRGISFGHSAIGGYYIDAIPEPATGTLFLLFIGIAAFIRKTR